jgi:four helix bundle protein
MNLISLSRHEGKRMNSERKNDLPERTKSFALEIVRVMDALPRTTSAQVLGKQALRSATSVGANYREASRARSKPEFISKIGDCLKEAEETGYWLELLGESRIVPAEKLASLLDGCRQLIAMLVTISKRARENL